MTPADRPDWREAMSGLARSYVADVRGWAAGLGRRYAVAAAIAVGGVLALFAAGAVGITALFHVIERYYGTNIAYASVGGGLFGIGIILLVLAWAMLRARTPPLPRPRRQAAAAKQMMMGSAAVRAATGFRAVEGVRADPVTQALIGAAATMLVGWIVASRLAARSQPRARQ
jgi:hypothetical protein